MFEDMLAIADDGSKDRVMVDGKLRVDNEVAARSRLRVDTRRMGAEQACAGQVRGKGDERA